MDEHIGAYKTADTMAKSQIDLILQVYDGAIDHYRQGRDLFAKEEYRGGRMALEKAKKFIVHLYTTLDLERGGEVGKNLEKMYSFVIGPPDVVAATKDLSQIDDIIEILTNLRKGWVGIKSEETNVVKEPQKAEPELAGGQFTTSG